ncbi:hypothetical protein D0B54_10840 [Solimonas sp. K1W22B-7]|uniref:hypothetical protein n=1 Tax=Solimonas sp. K1W22B-7 TaxID=2303331 RepID=UPI000E3348F7|nr:hypothetical protein [Solimonas sp. K1W22B-7]AXQ29152.1 hypothetical protein D0B54_10840 [Solimonas sp. K1W22B-7]
MNIRNILIAATLVAASGSAFAGKAPTTLGGFQMTGIAVVPKSVSDAKDDKKEEQQQQQAPQAQQPSQQQ